MPAAFYSHGLMVSEQIKLKYEMSGALTSYVENK